jgi:hypothetical protein
MVNVLKLGVYVIKDGRELIALFLTVIMIVMDMVSVILLQVNVFVIMATFLPIVINIDVQITAPIMAYAKISDAYVMKAGMDLIVV